MTAYPVERPLALAVKAALEAELGATKVGYGAKPAGGGWQTTGTPDPATTQFAGYAVVYPGLTGPTDGPVSATSWDAVQGWQVTYVGKSADQADAIRDRGRLALLGRVLTVTGRATEPVDLSDSTNVSRDADVQPPLFYAVDRYRARTTPS